MKKRLHHLLTAGGLIVAGLLSTACGEDVENLYSGVRAFFRFTPVTAAPPLNTALNNPGMFCTVTFARGQYHFTLSDGTSVPYSPTQIDQYGKPEYIAGFIVGTPALPDLSGNFRIAAYDLACPNCWSDNSITRALTFSSPTVMTCGRCHRNYDLNNDGMASDGAGSGRKLLRYRVTYSQNTLVIQN